MLPNVLYSSDFEIGLWPFHLEYTRSLEKKIIRPTDTIAFEKCEKKIQRHKDEAISQKFSFSLYHTAYNPFLKYTYGIISPASRKIYHERMGII